MPTNLKITFLLLKARSDSEEDDSTESTAATTLPLQYYFTCDSQVYRGSHWVETK
jgi:hypothetical protein